MGKWAPVVIWAALIFFLSSRVLPAPRGIFFWDVAFPYLAHLGEYAVLFLLLWRAEKKPLFCFFLTGVYALSDEGHQAFVPGRTASPIDVLVDMGGAIFAWMGIWKLLPVLPPPLRDWLKNWLSA